MGEGGLARGKGAGETCAPGVNLAGCTAPPARSVAPGAIHPARVFHRGGKRGIGPSHGYSRIVCPWRTSGFLRWCDPAYELLSGTLSDRPHQDQTLACGPQPLESGGQRGGICALRRQP
jgi:hypothetical protein